MDLLTPPSQAIPRGKSIDACLRDRETSLTEARSLCEPLLAEIRQLQKEGLFAGPGSAKGMLSALDVLRSNDNELWERDRSKCLQSHPNTSPIIKLAGVLCSFLEGYWQVIGAVQGSKDNLEPTALTITSGDIASQILERLILPCVIEFSQVVDEAVQQSAGLEALRAPK